MIACRTAKTPFSACNGRPTVPKAGPLCFIHIDPNRAILVAAAIDDENFCWFASGFVTHGVSHVRRDEAGFARTDAFGSFPVDFEGQFSLQSKHEFLGPRMNVPG